VADSNRDEKGSFQTTISQDVIDAALQSVERHVRSSSEDEEGDENGEVSPEAEASLDGGGSLEGELSLELEAPGADAEEPLAESVADTGELEAALEESRRELDETRQQLEQARRELAETRSQLEFSLSKGREMMERIKDGHERALRASADLENYKKRAQKEKEEVQKFGAERLLKDFLPVADNLDRALEAAQKSNDYDSLRTGVDMTRKLFDTAFGKHRVKGFSSVGQPFDPRLHEAMQQVESAAVPAGHVLFEAVRGYTLNERLIRPALVVVARAPAAPAPAPETPSETTPGGEPTGGATASEQTGTTPTGSQ
jgi:molecular chaperone GrpE